MEKDESLQQSPVGKKYDVHDVRQQIPLKQLRPKRDNPSLTGAFADPVI